MFDIGFWELTLVGLVGLIVIGPERLPAFVRVTGFWLGKARRTVASVKQEIKEELYAEDLKQTLADDSHISEVKNLIDETAADFNNTVTIDADPQVQDPEVQHLIDETTAGFEETVSLDSLQKTADTVEAKNKPVSSD